MGVGIVRRLRLIRFAVELITVGVKKTSATQNPEFWFF